MSYLKTINNDIQDQNREKSPLARYFLHLIFVLFFMSLIIAVIVFAIFSKSDHKINISQEPLKEEQSKIRLEQIINKFNFTKIGDVVDDGASNQIKSYLNFQNYIKDVTTKKETHRYSLVDIIGTEVETSSGLNIGVIDDILVHRWNGKVKILIVSNNNTYLRGLDLFLFEDYPLKEINNRRILTIHSNKPHDQDETIYDESKKQDWISLRRLKNGEILDYEGNFIGKTHTIIYANNSVQGLYFDLCPSFKEYQEKSLYLPFNVLHFIENTEKLGIILTKEQTQLLARCVFSKDTFFERKDK